jgi:hypothetical protein
MRYVIRVRFDRAGESVIVADLFAQIGHRFGIDASLTIDLGFSAQFSK